MLKLVLFIMSFLITGLTHAASAVFDEFNAGIGGWSPNTIETNVGLSPAGGNPGGYLLTDNLGDSTSFGVVGSVNQGADYSGDFADGLWTISVDLNFIRGEFNDAWLRFRYQNATFNGWHYSLTDTIVNDTWNSYSVTFDTTWTNAEAELNGWVQESLSPDFATLWDDVYGSEVRILGNNQLNMVAGIDNYSASVVPVPAAVWLMLSGLVGLVAVARKK